MQIKKYETKDRYGNSKSFEFFEGSADMEVPGMTDMPDHPGEPKGTDTVPAWLTPGEFVINKEATDMYGPLLKNINDEGRKMQSGEPHDHPSEAMYAAKGDVVPDTPMSQYEIYQYILSLGFNDNAARGIMSNIRHEVGSGFDSTRVQKTKEGNPVKGGGMGLFQWEKGDPAKPDKGGRYDTDPNNLLKFAKERNRNWTDPKTQLDFMNWEMRPQADDVAANKWRTWAALRKNMNNATSAGVAAQMFADKYERHKGPQQVSRTTWADDDSNFLDPNREGYVNGIMRSPTPMLRPKVDIETYEGFLGSNPLLRPTELGKSFNLDDAVNKALYKEAGGSIPQYYGIGDEVRDYYRSGIPMPGSVGTMATGSTWDIATEAAEVEQRERERQRQLFLAGSLDEVLKTSLEKDNVPELIKELIVPPANSMYEEDELRDYYRDGIPMPGSAGTMSSDSTWDQKTAEEKDMVEFRKEIEGPIKELRRLGDLRKYGGINEVASGLTEDSQDALENPVNVSEITVDDLPPVNTNTIKSNLIELGLLNPSSNIENFKEAVATGIPPIADGYKVPEVFNRDDRHGTPSGNYEELKILNRNAKEAQALRLKGEDMGTSIKTINDYSDEELKKLNAEIVAQKEKVRKAKIREDYKGQLKKEQERLESMITDTSVLEKKVIENKIALLQIDKKEALMLGNETGADDIQLKIDETIVESGTSKVNGQFVSNPERKAALNNLKVLDDGTTDSLDLSSELGLGKSFNLDDSVKKALEDKNPKFVKTKAFLSKYFGDLFDTKELSRMAVLYLGSRAAGASHNGSLAYSGKYYMKRMEAQDAAHLKNVNEYIKGGKHTAKSIGKFKVSRDANDLIRIGANGIASIEQLDKISVADKTGAIGGKKAYKLKLTMSDGSEQIILSFDKKNPKEIPDNWTKDLTYDPNSPEGRTLLKSNQESNVKFVQAYIKDFSDSAKGTVSSKYSNSKGGLNYMAIGTQAGTWATTHGFRSDLMPSVMEIALADMASDIGNEKKKLNPTEMRIAPYLNAALIRSSVAQDIGNVFSYDVDGEEQNMSTKEITSMNNKIMAWRGSGASLRTTESRTKLSSSYKELYDMFVADKNGTTVIYSQRLGVDGKALAWKNPIVGDKEQYEAAIKNKKSNESLFHAWLRATL